MEKRTFGRIPIEMDANIFWENVFYSGKVLNLSEKGMFINTNVFPPNDSTLDIIIILSNEHLKISSVVRRKIDKGKIDNPIKNNGIGVEILNPPKEYLQVVDNLRNTPQNN